MTSTDPFFGPEIVDLNLGGTVVRELKAATAFVLGTAPIHLVHETEEARAAYINKRIKIRRREDIAKHFGPVRDGYTFPANLYALFDQAGPKGMGTVVAVNIFDPDMHQTDGAPDPSAVTSLDAIGGFDETGQASGLSLAYGCFQENGWFAKLLLAPGLSAMSGVEAAMLVIARRTRGRALFDAPIGTTVDQVIASRGPNGIFDWTSNSHRAVGLWPFILATNLDETSESAGEAVPLPYSSFFAGVWLSSILGYGVQHSPSNRPIVGHLGTNQEVLYIPGDASSDSQALRGAGIVTLEERFGKGIHTAGNRSLSYPSSGDMRNFLHVQLIQDLLDEAMLFFLDGWKDRNASPASIEMIEDRINAWGRSKTTGRDPMLYDFRFTFDRKQTTPELVSDGHFFWKLDYAPVGVMERLTVVRNIDIDLIRNPLGLANSQTGDDDDY